VTGPGGLIVLTIHGEYASAHADPDERARAERGIVFVRHPEPGVADWYGVTYHPHWYVRAHWKR
jgi:hypothetical protein